MFLIAVVTFQNSLHVALFFLKEPTVLHQDEKVSVKIKRLVSFNEQLKN